MSDNYVRELATYCTSRSLQTPLYISSELPATREKQVKVVINDYALSDFANTEEEATNKAAKAMLDKLRSDSDPKLATAAAVDQLVLKTEKLDITYDDHSLHSSELIEDEVSRMPNPIGYLNEFCSKNRLQQPDYTPIAQHGESHRPLFIIECSLHFRGQRLVTQGKGCPKTDAKKRAAHAMIRRVHQIGSAPEVKPIVPLNTDISAYFAKKFNKSEEIDKCFVENGTDVCVQIEKLSALIGCQTHYQSSPDGSQVIKIMINEHNYPLVTTFGANKALAAKKAILMLKILYTNQ